MAYKEVSRVDVTEVIRRWQMGSSQRQTASGTGLSRDTVRKYIAAAKELGVSQEGPAPTGEQLSKLAGLSWIGSQKKATPAEEKLEPWGDQIYQWVTVDRLQVTRIQELLAQRGCAMSYTSLRRFLQRRNCRRRSLRTVPMENTPPGEVAEPDLGRLGFIQDQETVRRRVVWALLVVLTYSRHSFLWPTFGQTLEDVISGLEAAWEFFGGIPKYLVIDNFPAAVAGADALHPLSPVTFWNTPRIGASSPTRPGCAIPRTSRVWSAASSTPGKASSRGPSSGTWPTSVLKRSAGVVTSPECASTAPPVSSPCRPSWTRSARLCSLGTASSTNSTIGVPRKFAQVTTWAASMPFIGCRPPCARPGSGWKAAWA